MNFAKIADTIICLLLQRDDGDMALPRKRVPRILHFSDGVIEEYSDEEMDQLDSAPSKLQEPPVDPVST
jgi:hypothetical protein